MAGRLLEKMENLRKERGGDWEIVNGKREMEDVNLLLKGEFMYGSTVDRG